MIVTVRHAVAEEQFGAARRSWAFYGGDAGGSRYSPLNQIDKSNVARLKPVWEYHTGDVSDGSGDRPKSEFEATPIVVGETMFVSTPFNRVVALDLKPERKNGVSIRIDLHTRYSGADQSRCCVLVRFKAC
jgi:quinoprotein glucose dehydrogenase